MQNTVRDWMNDLVVFVDPDATVTEALKLMRRRYVNSLIVRKTDTNPEYGIVTSIDVCDKIVAHGRNPSELKVREIMSSPLITVSKDATVEECAKLMLEKRIHHLPVADEHGNIVGMISATDFLFIAETMGQGGGDRVVS
ncbi:MAG: CBS domain-containing protein [Thermanaerothrix sp.]|nr:CBS domain-containing protein [Thermanaerothrix sp.]